MMKRLLLAAAALIAFASPALAGQPVVLKAETVDTDGLVTLSDLFDNTGAAGKVPVAAKPGASVILNAAAVQGVARRAGLDWANAEGVRSIVVRGASAGVTTTGAVAGQGNVQVLTYARSFMTGEIVQAEDLVWGKAVAAPFDAPRDADAIIGQAARRPLRAGAPVTNRDVSAPQVIKSGDLITVVYEADGVSLSLQAKAQSSAGVGETLTVLNAQSKKTLQAVAIAPGQAAVGPAAEAAKSLARRNQYALR